MLLTAAGGGAARTLVFLPGFMGSAESYRELLTPVAEGGTTVIVPQLYRRGVAALLGRVPVAAEAEAAAELVRATAHERPGSAVFLGGHSRGGQAAWRAAGLLAPGLPAGLVLLDPVDGEGRDATTPTGTVGGARFTCRALIIGAGIGGRCAPAPVNHEVFAAATPGSSHVVVTRLGHADMLSGRGRALGRRLCPGADDPDPGRAACTALIDDFLLGALRRPAGTPDDSLLSWRS